MSKSNVISQKLLTHVQSLMLGGCACLYLGGPVTVQATAAPVPSNVNVNVELERSIIDAHQKSAAVERVAPSGLSTEALKAFAKPQTESHAYAWCAR